MIGVDLPDDTSGIFFDAGLDDPNQIELAQENSGFGAGDFAAWAGAWSVQGLTLGFTPSSNRSARRQHRY
jgi:hypothetical protein